MSTTYFTLPGYYDTNLANVNSKFNVLAGENDGRAGNDNLGAWQVFDRFYSVNMRAEELSARHYVFMLRPDLYIFEELSEELKTPALSTTSRVNSDPYFKYIGAQYPWILNSLSSDFGNMSVSINEYKDNIIAQKTGKFTSSQHKFIPYVTSRVESIQIPDFTIGQDKIVQPYSKYSIPFSTTSNDSITGGSFDITFREDSNYSMHKLFYTWLYYQNAVSKNIFRPKDRYLLYNAIDYATSVYSILVDATGEKILYWVKYTGVVPTSVPLSNMSFNRGGTANNAVSISFSYFYCEHMDPNALVDFNYNSLGYSYMDSKKTNKMDMSEFTFVPTYDALHFLGSNLVGRPVITLSSGGNGKPVYLLKWLD